jgi:hypothetical protein
MACPEKVYAINHSARGNPDAFHKVREVSGSPDFAETRYEMPPSQNAETNTAKTTATVANVPTMLKYESSRRVRSSAVGMVKYTVHPTGLGIHFLHHYVGFLRHRHCCALPGRTKSFLDASRKANSRMDRSYVLGHGCSNSSLKMV